MTDTTYTNDLNLASATASKAVLTNDSKNLVTGTVPVNTGGTGQTSWTQWGILYASASTTLANTTAGTAGYLLQSNASSAPSWIQATDSNTASTIVKRDASGNFSAGTITAVSLILTSTTDASATANNNPALVIGDATGAHIEIDNNEIMAKASATTVNNLSLNYEGGNIIMGVDNANYNVQIRSTASSSSISTGALVVSGGVGINGSIHASESLYAPGFYTVYNSTNYPIISNPQNGNIIVNAASNGLYLGYQNTTAIDFLNNKMVLNSDGLELKSGKIALKQKGNNFIYNGPNDGIYTYGGALGNLVIDSWYGVSFTTSCANTTYTGTNAVSINCRNGNTYIGGVLSVASSLISYSAEGLIISSLGSPWPYIRFDTRAGGTSYITTDVSTWAQLYAQVPAKTASNSSYSSTRFFFREYSKTANTTTRLSYYEDFYLPAVNDGRTDSITYNILTTKDLSFSITGNAATATTASQLSFNTITSESQIASGGTRTVQGSGSNWTGSVESMRYAGILSIGGDYSRGWQIWAPRGATNSLYWRNPNSDANAWTTPRVILDSSNFTSYTGGTMATGTANYVAYYSGTNTISCAKSINYMIMPGHYYHNLYSDNPTTGTMVYVHYYNPSTTSTNTGVQFRVKSDTSYKIFALSGDGAGSWDGDLTVRKLYISQSATTRNNGIIGTYDYTKAALIWSMDSAFNIAADGSGLGNLYGAAYGYQTQTPLGGSQLAGGHQFLWCQNGQVTVALGNGVWTTGLINTSGNLSVAGSASVVGNITANGIVYSAGAGERWCEAQNTTYGNRLCLDVSANGQTAGIWSSGYVNSSGTYTAGAKWLIYRNVNNAVVIGDTVYISGNAYIGTSGSYYFSSGGELAVSGNVRSGNPISFLTTSSTAQAIKAGGLVSSYTYTDNAGAGCLVLDKNTTNTADTSIFFYTQGSARAGFTFAGNKVTFSSREKKNNILPLKSFGEEIDKLNLVSFSYKWDPDDELTYGLIYEDTINILPYICFYNPDDIIDKGISYEKLIPIMLKEIQELRKRVKELELSKK